MQGQNISGPAGQYAAPLLVSPRQAARMLAISERTLATYTKSGILPVVRLGHSVRYSPDDLREWIKRTTEKKCGNGQNCT
jgi:excisionase family DNA binding protein